MATVFEKAFGNYEKRVVGNLNSWKIRTLAHGAQVTEDIDNFLLVQLGFDGEGQRTATTLEDVGTKGYLIASPERRYMDEPIDSFYNAKGEFARIVYLDEGLRFETSAFESEAENGMFAHFNPATKKFLVHDGAHEDYEGAADKFLVVGNEEDTAYTLGQATVRLEVL